MSDSGIPLSPPVPEPVRPIEVIVVRPRRPRYWLHLLLLVATFFTTTVVGARLQFDFAHGLPAFDTDNLFPVSWVYSSPALVLRGIPFSLTLMLILLAHEMGHYLYAKRYNVSATLPFFVPAPTLIGTLGAFIRITSRIWSRAALFDIGIAGPIAGFVVTIPVLIVGLLLSKPASLAIPQEFALGFPLGFEVAHRLLSPFSPVLRSHPLPALTLHPVAIAAWVGMLATSLNLLPGGQLDGGHIIYALAPKWHRYASLGCILVLIPLAYFTWAGWLIWAVMVGFTGLRHPNVPSQPALGTKRRRAAWIAVFMLLLTFMPAPFQGGAIADGLAERGIQLHLWHR